MIDRRRWGLLLAGLMVPGQLPAQDGKVYRVAIHGAVEHDHGELVSAAIARAKGETDAIILLDIAAAGGRFDAAQLIALEFDGTEVPIVALISQQTGPAPALIALGADSIFVTPRAAQSDAEPPDQDISDAARNAMRSVFTERLESRGLDAQLGASMIDEAISIPDVVESGEVLTLGDAAAMRVGLVTDIVADIDELLARMDRDSTQVVTIGDIFVGTTIRVKNRNTRDLRVYVVRGSRFRLGQVTSMNQVEFNLTQDFLSEGATIQILAEVIGSSEQVSTERVRVEPGLLIEWTIEEQLPQSSYFFWRRY